MTRMGNTEKSRRAESGAFATHKGKSVAITVKKPKIARTKPHKQLSFQKVTGWGGKRANAGRPNKSGTMHHMKRPTLNSKTPLHITMRLAAGVPNLRNKKLLKAFKACIAQARHHGLHVIQFSLQTNHLHIIAEAKSNKALGCGMRSLAGRWGKLLRRHAEKSLRRPLSGAVFRGRYHLHVLKTPRETKNALKYVLLNTSKHRDMIEHLDIYSSAAAFQNWRSLLGGRFAGLIQTQSEGSSSNIEDDEWQGVLSPPQSWLCRQGWQRG